MRGILACSARESDAQFARKPVLPLPALRKV